MELIYYRDFNLNKFFTEVDFNLSSEYTLKCSPKYNSKDEHTATNVEISFEINFESTKNIFKNDIVLTDVCVIVGQNGVGKSTFIDDIIFFSNQSSLRNSWKCLLSKNFLLLGDNIEISLEQLHCLIN